MPDAKSKNKPHGTEPPPQPDNAAGQPMPRRTSPGKSITLQHHRLAQENSQLKGQNSSTEQQRSSSQVPQISVTKSPVDSTRRRNSSGDSHDTGHSDPNKWFEKSNGNPTASFSHAMDVDPPFYQKETDSSNEDDPKLSYPYHLRPGASTSLKPAVPHSNSTDDYRSVIDDLTVEIQRLKDELKKYKQPGPDTLRKDKLFEIKMHGLPKRKKRELESTLRDFASGMSETPSGGQASSDRKKHSRHADRLYSGSGSMSKHASSSSGSNSRPADSAYASMSTNANSSGTSLARPTMTSRAKSSEQKVENYLNDIPEGLYPRHMVMTDKDKKKLVVKRLEQLFTGKITGRHLQRNQKIAPSNSSLAPVMGEATATSNAMMHHPPSLMPNAQPAREARILAPDESGSGKKSRSRDNASTENSNGDQTESGGNSAAVGETNNSPPDAPLPEQRPTRPKDLDPDRAQNPSENMDYIRHLGLVPPELMPEAKTQDVAPDADGWVYLNLLCNLAQLHIINVTPDFIRNAVSEKSAMFQLSPDGRKIRWRGGTEGTKFHSDSSGDNSQMSPNTEDSDGSNKHGQRKKRKSGPSAQQGQATSGDDFTSAHSSKNASKAQAADSSESFHYKPIFAHQTSSIEQTSLDDTVSSFGPAEESNIGESRWGNSGSGTSQRKKRRLDGAVIYYSGAPFCTDLSGDPGDASPTTYMASTGDEDTRMQSSDHNDDDFVRPDPPQRTESGSTQKLRPLSDELFAFRDKVNVDPEPCIPGLTSAESSDGDMDSDMPWSDSQQVLHFETLEPCGLGGVMPDDHFMLVVTTKRSKDDSISQVYQPPTPSDADLVVQRLASMTTSSPCGPSSLPRSRSNSPSIEIDYVSGRIKRLNPVPLPPPAMFIPPFSSGSDSSSDDELESSDEEDEYDTSEGFISRRAPPALQQRHSDNHYPDDEDMTSGDEEGEEPDNEDEPQSDSSSSPNQGINMALPPHRAPVRRTSSSAIAAPGTIRGRSKSMSAELPQSGTSNATIGDAESGYSSSEGSG